MDIDDLTLVANKISNKRHKDIFMKTRLLKCKQQRFDRRNKTHF